MQDSFLYGMQRCFAEAGEEGRCGRRRICVCGRKSMKMKTGDGGREYEYESESVCGRIGMREKARMRMNVYKIEGG